MKVILLIFFTFVVYSCEASNIGPLYGNSLDEVFEQKCISNGLSKDYFRLTLDATYDCISEAFDPVPPHLIQYHQKFCKYLTENKFYGCMKNFTTDLLPCLNETEVYLQHFLLTAISSGYNEICGPNGSFNIKYLEEKMNQTDECLIIPVLFYMSNVMCLSDLIFFKNLEKNVLNLNKKNVCLDLESLRKCSTETIDKICNNGKNKEDFSRLTGLVFQPFLEQCKHFIGRN